MVRLAGKSYSTTQSPPQKGHNSIYPHWSAHHETFQSTRSLRSATFAPTSSSAAPYHFNPRAPYGARLQQYSPPALYHKFQSTRSLRSATIVRAHRKIAVVISIHALLTERDKIRGETQFTQRISIHALLTERDNPHHARARGGKAFQSTRSLRSATAKMHKFLMRSFAGDATVPIIVPTLLRYPFLNKITASVFY